MARPLSATRAILSSGHGRHPSAVARIARSSVHGEGRQWHFHVRGSSGGTTDGRAPSQEQGHQRSSTIAKQEVEGAGAGAGPGVSPGGGIALVTGSGILSNDGSSKQ